MPAPAPSPRAQPFSGELDLRHQVNARARAEAALLARAVDAEARLAARVLVQQRTSALLDELRAELDGLRDALAGERARREEAERRVAELERELAGQRTLSHEAHDAIGELRTALERLAAPRADAPPVAHRPDRPLGEPAPAAQGPPADALVEPARLNDALTRLRETIAPQDAAKPGREEHEPSPAEDEHPPPTEAEHPPPAEAEHPLPAEAELPPPAEAGQLSPAQTRHRSLGEVLSRPSLEQAFRRLVKSDADAAGRLLLELLPLQRIVYPHPVSYDLVLGGGRAAPGVHGCVCVTVPDGTTSIAVQSAPRPREQVDFQVIGDPGRIARLLTAGRFRRRFGRRVARVRGRRDGLAALSALLGTPLDLSELHRAGVRLDPATALALVAAMIDPAWTAGDRFILAHAGSGGAGAFLIVDRGARPQAARSAPAESVSATITCPANQLLAVLCGLPAHGSAVHGDERVLVLLRQWIKRAQSE